MLIAVTGATGFVGRHLVNLLLERGHRVRALVRGSRVVPVAQPQRVERVAGDLRDAGALRTLVTRADAVVHLVGIIVDRGAATFEAIHVDGTRAVVEAARAAGCPRLVHMSATGARDEPGATRYHRTKRRAEMLVEQSGIPHVIFRPSLISGPENVPIQTLIRLHRWSPVVPVFGDGAFPLQPVWVDDVALAFALAAENPAHQGTLELGGPDVLTYEEFVRAIGRAAEASRPVVHVPLGLIRLVAFGFDLLGPWAPITSDQLQMLVEGSATPSNAIEKVLGIKPVGFEEGLRRFL